MGVQEERFLGVVRGQEGLHRRWSKKVNTRKEEERFLWEKGEIYLKDWFLH